MAAAKLTVALSYKTLRSQAESNSSKALQKGTKR
jgi:hypothetical protein